VGATNFDVQRLQEMVEGGVKIVNNQASWQCRKGSQRSGLGSAGTGMLDRG